MLNGWIWGPETMTLAPGLALASVKPHGSSDIKEDFSVMSLIQAYLCDHLPVPAPFKVLKQ